MKKKKGRPVRIDIDGILVGIIGLISVWAMVNVMMDQSMNLGGRILFGSFAAIMTVIFTVSIFWNPEEPGK